MLQCKHNICTDVCSNSAKEVGKRENSSPVAGDLLIDRFPFLYGREVGVEVVVT